MAGVEDVGERDVPQHVLGLLMTSVGLPPVPNGGGVIVCVADVAELTRLETGEDRSGMFFAARTFAFKMGQALAMVVFTTITAIDTEDNISSGLVTLAQVKQCYRTTAIVALITCFIGAVLFFAYNEKKLLGRIKELKGSEEI